MTARAALPRYFTRADPTLLQDFDTLTDFTIAGTPDVSEIVTDRLTIGDGSLKITAAAGGATTVDFTISETFGPTRPFHMMFRYFIEESVNFTNTQITIGTDPGFGAGTWVKFDTAHREGERDQSAYQTGWNTIFLDEDDSASGTPSLLNDESNVFTIIRITMNAGKGPIWIDGMWLDAF